MKRALGIILKAFPWVGMLVFGWLWISELGSGIGWNYVEDSFKSLERDNQALETYIIARRGFATDLEAFKTLEMIEPDQYDDKYAPWVRTTRLGLVKFDEDGFIEKICLGGSRLKDEDCPPQL